MMMVMMEGDGRWCWKMVKKQWQSINMPQILQLSSPLAQTKTKTAKTFWKYCNFETSVREIKTRILIRQINGRSVESTELDEGNQLHGPRLKTTTDEDGLINTTNNIYVRDEVDVDGKKFHRKFLIGCLICMREEWTEISTTVMTQGWLMISWKLRKTREKWQRFINMTTIVWCPRWSTCCKLAYTCIPSPEDTNHMDWLY